MQNVDLAPVHVGEQLLQVLGIDILEVDNRVFVWPRVEESSEVGTADGENQLVRLKDLPPAGQGDITQLLGAAKVLHNCKKARMVVIPL